MENDKPQIKLYAFTLDCKEPRELADFHARLLGWMVPFADEVYAGAAPAGVAQGGYPGITFQKNPEFVPPVWPEEPGAQQQMAHLDFVVNDLEKAVLHAVDCGARVADKQFTQDWTVMFDPAGHPFCLCRAPFFDGKDFKLL